MRVHRRKELSFAIACWCKKVSHILSLENPGAFQIVILFGAFSLLYMRNVQLYCSNTKLFISVYTESIVREHFSGKL